MRVGGHALCYRFGAHPDITECNTLLAQEYRQFTCKVFS